MQKHWPIILILAVSLVIHFAYFGQPAETVFDEVHFGKFISGYFTHQYFFDIHPPLGKLLISGMGYLGGFKPGFSFAEIGQKFTDHTYLWLRFLPTLAGALLPLVIYWLAVELGLSRWGALVAGLFHTLNHAIFKSLLFMGAGSVITKTHTRNMEEYGGLIKVMPATALFFLIGSMAISALPPFDPF